MLTPPASIARFLIAAALLCLASRAVFAEEPPVTIHVDRMGAYDSTGVHTAGQVHTGDFWDDRESRAYFVFDLFEHHLVGEVRSAVLTVQSSYYNSRYDDSELVCLFEVGRPEALGTPKSVQVFEDLGDGPGYGSVLIPRPGPPPQPPAIIGLSSAALKQINDNLNGIFAIGSRCMTLGWPGVQEFVWGSAPEPDLTVTLVLNRAPVADAGPDQTVPCGADGLAQVTLDGSASSDPDGDPLTYIWSCCPDENAAVVTVSLHCGVHNITLTVADGTDTDSDLVVVTVLDLMPPWVSPPDPVTVPQTQPEGALVYLDAALVLDNCDPAPTLTDDAPPDHIFPVGTTIVTYTAEDYSGNRATAQTTVTVTPWIPPLSAQGPRVLKVPDQGTFTASGGQEPYTWTVSDPAIARIIGETTGASVTVEGVGPGYCTVSVHDSCSQEIHLELLVILFAGPQDQRTCVNHEITLTATAEPLGSNTCNPVLWSCDGDPATGDGVSFTTKFSTPGAHVVHVTYEVEGLQFSAQCTVTAVTVAGISPPGPLTVCRGKTITFTAISAPEGGFGECQPVWSGTSGASGSGVSIDVTFNTVSTDEADYQTVEVSCPSDPENVHTALVLVVQLDHMDYTTSDGRQGTVGEPAVLTVCRGASVTFTAYNQVGLTDFPDDCPEWSGTSGVTGTGNPKDVAFSTTSETLADLKTVTAHCGISITASVLVVEVDRIEPPAHTACLDDLVTFTAVARPAGASFPPDCPTWGGTALVSGTGATVTFPAVELGEFSVTATCGRTASAALTVISGPLDPHPPGDFSVDGNGDDVQVTGQPWVATKYYYSDPYPSSVGLKDRFLILIDRYIPSRDNHGHPARQSIERGVISPVARLRLWAPDGLPPPVALEGEALPTGTRIAGMCGVAVFEYVLDVRLLVFPRLRGQNGQRPAGAENWLRIWHAGAYTYELSFDVMSPYILIHGKGALGGGADAGFWWGRNPQGKHCWRGLAAELEDQGIPFDSSISLWRKPPYDISQQSIIVQAQELDDEPARLAASFGTRHVNFICHSKGGLDAREWLVNVKPRRAPDLIVGQFITLDTPHLGSAVADYAVKCADLSVLEVRLNTGLNVYTVLPLALNPHLLFRVLNRLLTAASPTDYPMLVVVPKIANYLHDLNCGVNPKSPATVDMQTVDALAFSQRNFALLRAYTNVADGTTPTFLAVRADADLNSNGEISIREKWAATKYDTFSGAFADTAYCALRDVASVQLDTSGWWTKVIENPTPSPELNDFLVTYGSAWPNTLPPNTFGLAGTLRRDHGTIADDETGAWLMGSGFAMPSRK